MSDNTSGISGFIQELRSRRVFRVAAVYLGAAYVILESSEMVFPRLGLPDWTVTLVLGLLGLGFPVAIIMAWAFVVTPDGLSRSAQTQSKQTTDQKPLTSNLIITSLLIVIVGLLAYPRIFDSDSPQMASESSIDPKSIAVLPFSSFSDSKDSEHFSDGMTDVILTQLAKVKDLKVISRTSIMQYKGTQKDIKEIASELGVAHVLEGSVQRAGDKVRIVSQLIKADTDEHVWAETYDRNYAEIFDLQSEVARSIASALKATLTPEEETYLNSRPTDNQAAWDFYVQAKILRDDLSNRNDEEYVELFNKAADLDPKFLLPRAFLVRLYSNNYFNRRKPVEENLEKAKKRLEEVLSISPDTPESHLAQGFFHYYASLEFTKALEEFTIAQQSQPNNSDLHEAMAFIKRRLGRWDEAYKDIQRAVELDPNAGRKLSNLFDFSLQLRKWSETKRYMHRMILMDKTNEYLRVYQILFPALESGDLQKSRKLLDSLSTELPENVLRPAREQLAYYSRDFQTALELAYLDTSDRIDTKARYHQLLGNRDSSLFYFDSIRTKVENRLSSEPPIYWMYTTLGNAYAHLGNKKGAIDAIAKAKELLSVEDDAIAGTYSLYGQANIYQSLGEYDESLDIYEQLLNIPSEFNVRFLLLDPYFDELRDHPRYKNIIKKHKPAEWSHLNF